MIFKRLLTTMQITQFVVGASVALSYLWFRAFDFTKAQYVSCLYTEGQKRAVYINVAYLAPLTYVLQLIIKFPLLQYKTFFSLFSFSFLFSLFLPKNK